jgi:hypothetical protein
VAGISNPDGSGTTSEIKETLINTTAEPVTVHYIITPSVNGCDGTPFDLSVTVNPTAVITSEATANWCNNTENTYTATSSSTTATFAWTRAAVAGISNPDGSGTTSEIKETLINTTAEPVTVHYIITPSVNGCDGTPFDLSVTVNPTAVITSEATANWCNNTENTYTATSSSTTATFAWTRAAVAGISNPDGSGTTSEIKETLINTTAEPVTVHYIITPSVNGCDGTPFDLSVTVNPTAVITSEATANWCNNTENTYTATSSSTTATFAWTRAAVAGISNPDGSGTTSEIKETLINTTAEPVTVHYIITPSVNGCDGTPFDLSVTVNPTAVITSEATANWCNNTENTYTATSSSTTATFAWTRAAVAGISNPDGSGTTSEIKETLINTTAEPVTVHYIITPSVNGCDGTPFDLSVTVNPTAVITSEATANWCNNTENTYTATSSSTTATFAWTRAAVAGISNPDGSGTTSEIKETLINTTAEPVTVHYIITPSVNGCDGTPFDLSVTVNPTAVITSEATANWCNNTENTYTATSSSTTATFAWTRAAVAGISNPDGSGTTSEIKETLINTTAEPVTVHYIITPSVNGCDGTPFDLSVTVNPTAVITSEATANWCNNTENTYTATSSSTTATFAWTRAAVAGISNPDGSGTTSEIKETLINTTAEPVTVHYIITPSVNGCDGTPFDLSVTVNPTAVITSEATANWCNNTENTYTATSSSTTATFAWTRAAVAGISNPDGSGTTSEIKETLINTTAEPVTVHYIITPSVNGCDGTPFDLSVTVNPTAVITSEATANWCNNTENTYTATSSSTTATFAWTRAAVAGISNPDGSGTTSEIKETLINTTAEPVTVHYIITPSVNGCDGTPFDLSVTVNPTAVITSEATANWCNNTENTYTATSSSTTATFAWTRAAVAGISNPDGSGTTSEIKETLINTTAEPVTVHYIITPSVNGCDGTPFDLSVTVNPTAVITSEATANWCNNTENTYTATSSSTTATFAWTRAAVAGISNPDGSGATPEITETLINITTGPVVVHYIITASVGTCTGTPFDLAVTINPTPQVDPVENQVVCNETTTEEVIFKTINEGGITTYTWTNDQESIGLAALGDGNIPEFIPLNTGTVPVIATIEVTPHFEYGSAIM